MSSGKDFSSSSSCRTGSIWVSSTAPEDYHIIHYVGLGNGNSSVRVFPDSCGLYEYFTAITLSSWSTVREEISNNFHLQFQNTVWKPFLSGEICNEQFMTVYPHCILQQVTFLKYLLKLWRPSCYLYTYRTVITHVHVFSYNFFFHKLNFIIKEKLIVKWDKFLLPSSSELSRALLAQVRSQCSVQ